MSEEEEEEERKLGTINSAINALEAYIHDNQVAGRKVMLYLFIVSTVGISMIFIPFMSRVVAFSSKDTVPSKTFIYVIAGIFVVVFGVLMAVYRFHLNEIARATHYKIGFMRIRVAANNFNREGFHTEVRQSLTERAFDYSTSSLLGSKGKQVESPLPGHPTSDISAMVINKLLEGFELKKK
jgi:hypothetical protein